MTLIKLLTKTSCQQVSVGCKETSRILIGIEILAIGHFRGTKIIGGGSQLDRLLLELDNWITAGQVSAGAGTEARGDWIHGKWKEVVEF